MVQMVDTTEPLEPYSTSLSTTATDKNIAGGVQVVSELGQRKPLNMCSTTGWKWAQHEDAEWMLNDFIKQGYGGKIWGLDMHGKDK